MAYGPTQKAKNNPGTTFVDGVRVGIGGKVIIKRGEGKPSTEVPEATPAQYEKLKHLITLVTDGSPATTSAKAGASLKDMTKKATEKVTNSDEGNRKSATSEPATQSNKG